LGAGATTVAFTIVGVVRFGTSNALQGATLTFLELTTAQKYFDAVANYDLIYASIKKDESKTIVRDRIQAVLPKDYQAITGVQSTKEQLQTIGKGLTFLRYIHARVCSHLALRRNLHDLQHLYHHDRPAPARARPAACGWCIAQADCRSRFGGRAGRWRGRVDPGRRARRTVIDGAALGSQRARPDST